jgi:hypothetical protein
MLTEFDKNVLESMSKKLLVKKSEIATSLKLDSSDGVDVSIGKLKELGYIDKVEALVMSYVITQKGLRALKGEV